jgi:hypothetical protein
MPQECGIWSGLPVSSPASKTSVCPSLSLTHFSASHINVSSKKTQWRLEVTHKTINKMPSKIHHADEQICRIIIHWNLEKSSFFWSSISWLLREMSLPLWHPASLHPNKQCCYSTKQIKYTLTKRSSQDSTHISVCYGHPLVGLGAHTSMCFPACELVDWRSKYLLT